MSFPHVLRCIPCVATLVVPAHASAQATALGGEIFWAHTTSLPGSPGLGGFAATFQSGGVGVRMSGGLSQRYDAFGAIDTPWMADADLFINSGALGQAAAVALGGFRPVGFAGIGQQGVRDGAGSTSNVSTFSYGGGASVPLFAGLRLAAEIRQRRALAPVPETMAPGLGTGRELRLSLTFGGRHAVRSPATPGRRGGGVVLAGGTRGSATASASARRVLMTGEEYLGVRYVYGGEDPRTGLDCSAFTQLVFRRNGVTLPRTSRQQRTVGREVLMDYGVMRAGDLLFFASNGSRVDHVAIYAGDYQILHATSSGNAVRYDDLRSPRGEWFANHLVAVRRVLADDGRSLVGSLEAARRLTPTLDRGDLAPQPR